MITFQGQSKKYSGIFTLALYIVTSKNAILGIFRDGNEKCRFSVSFIFNHLRD